jgi:hypothetical protein
MPTPAELQTAIAGAATTHAAQLEALAAQVGAITTGGMTPFVWPTGVNCIAGGAIHSFAWHSGGDSYGAGDLGAPTRERRLANWPDGAIPWFSDSIGGGVLANLIHPAAANFGMAGITMRRALSAIASDEAVKAIMRKSSATVFGPYVNDLAYYGARKNSDGSVNTAAADCMLAYFYGGNGIKSFATGNLVIPMPLPRNEPYANDSSVLGYNAQVADLTARIPAAMVGCAAQIAYVYVPAGMVDSSGNLKMIYTDDGQHLNALGAWTWAAAFPAAFQSLGL